MKRVGCYDMWDETAAASPFSMIRSASTGSFVSLTAKTNTSFSISSAVGQQASTAFSTTDNTSLGAGLNAFPFLPASTSLALTGDSLVSSYMSVTKSNKRSLPPSPPSNSGLGFTSLNIPSTFGLTGRLEATNKLIDWCSVFGNRDSVPWLEFFSKFRGFEDPNAIGPSIYADLATAQREMEYSRIRNSLYLKHALKVGNFLTYTDQIVTETEDKDEDEVHMLLGDKDEHVTKHNFEGFLQLFGPLIANKEHMVMSRVLEAMTQDGFVGFVSTSEAEAIARKCQGYLIRFSASEAGKFTVTKYLRDTGRVIHYRISIEITPLGERKFRLSKTITATSWLQIREILQLNPPTVSPPLRKIIECKMNSTARREIQKQKKILEQQQELARIKDDQEGILNSPSKTPIELQQLFEQQLNFSGIKVRAVPIHPFIQPNQQSVSVHVLFEAFIGDVRSQGAITRQPFNLALVLDRSSSMASVLTTAGIAVKRIISSMTPDDVIHLVAYSDHADVIIREGRVLTEADRTKLFELVDSITAKGSTNISTGLETARNLIKATTATANGYCSRIFLFSDGQPNKGLIHLDALSGLANSILENDGIRTTSFGIGVAFDEAIMKSISVCGGGDYFFIQDESQIREVVEKGFESILRLVGTNAYLEITPSVQEAVKVKHIYGEPSLITKNGTKMGDIRRHDLMQVLIEVEVDTTKVNAHDTEAIVQLMDFRFTFEPLYLALAADLNTHYQTSVCLCVSDNPALLMQHNDDVAVCLGLRQCGEIEAKLLQLIDVGQFTSAVQLKRNELVLLKRIQQIDSRYLVDRRLMIAQKAYIDLREKFFASQIRSITSATLDAMDNLSEMKKEAHYEGYYYSRYSNF
eukprot:TRINITY_DN3245_c0_g1_i1.p1 TRINITY_DN3245_c0_g1~~TRINITY_DN3245_c0_g1_i1.p1  ORF type:complete len:866 (+),score=143.26 TRINITY_DN3245_c0_g1_i1:424-3021(+)